MIDLLEKLHMKGYIHCDIKPDNIMIGNFKVDPSLKSKLYLIDFGLSKRYLDENGNHVEFRKNVAFQGNLIFSSKNAFGQVTLSRRDDLISLIYFLIFCVDSKLDWIDLTRPISDQFNEIARYKILTKPRELCQKPGRQFLYPLCKYIYQLNFKEKPDYQKMRFLLEKVLLDIDIVPGKYLDWTTEASESSQSLESKESSCDMDPRDLSEDYGAINGNNSVGDAGSPYLKNIGTLTIMQEKLIPHPNEPLLHAASVDKDKLFQMENILNQDQILNDIQPA